MALITYKLLLGDAGAATLAILSRHIVLNSNIDCIILLYTRSCHHFTKQSSLRGGEGTVTEVFPVGRNYVSWWREGRGAFIISLCAARSLNGPERN